MLDGTERLGDAEDWYLAWKIGRRGIDRTEERYLAWNNSRGLSGTEDEY